MSIVKAIDTCFEVALRRKWNRTYWAFDLHGTVIKPNFQKGNTVMEFYPHAIEVMQELSRRKDIGMMLYTCSHLDEIEEYLKTFKKNNITFDFINENTEVKNDGTYGCYDKKPYFNVLFEDKSGFDPYTDWLKVKEQLVRYPESYLL